LAGKEVKSPAAVVVGEVGVAQAQRPAVALVVVRRRAGAQEVALVVARELLPRVEIALDEERDSALPGGPVKLVLVVER
jgi:hypothetical protein